MLKRTKFKIEPEIGNFSFKCLKNNAEAYSGNYGLIRIGSAFFYRDIGISGGFILGYQYPWVLYKKMITRPKGAYFKFHLEPEPFITNKFTFGVGWQANMYFGKMEYVDYFKTKKNAEYYFANKNAFVNVKYKVDKELSIDYELGFGGFQAYTQIYKNDGAYALNFSLSISLKWIISFKRKKALKAN